MGDTFKKYMTCRMPNSFVCNDVTLSELSHVMSLIKLSKSPGPDNFSSYIMNISKECILEPLVHIFNLSFSTGVFPSDLKSSLVIPLYKKGRMDCMSNYRPIALSSVFSKLIEKLMFTRLISFFNKFNILYDFQFGFRKNHSTSMALFEVVEMIIKELDSKNNVMGIFLDLQKAFDTVNVDILLYKLSCYGVRGHLLDWFNSFLFNRSICTLVGNSISTSSIVNCGVPQGSVLGPLLFLVYINDIANGSPGSKIRLFADDANVFIIDRSIFDLFDKANIVLNDLNLWFISNKLSINIEKTNYMIFKPSKFINDTIKFHNLSLSVNNVSIERTFVTKYLGVWIDEMLNWKCHISHLVKKNSSFIGIFYKKQSFLPFMCRKNLYYSLIYSNLIYGLELYGNTTISVLKPLHVSCNRVLRALQGKTKRSNVNNLYCKFNTLPIGLLFKYSLLLLVYRCNFVKSSVPKVIHNMFISNLKFHNYHTRSSLEIHLFHNSRSSLNSYVFLASTYWNNIQILLSKVITFQVLKLI